MYHKVRVAHVYRGMGVHFARTSIPCTISAQLLATIGKHPKFDPSGYLVAHVNVSPPSNRSRFVSRSEDMPQTAVWGLP